MGILQRFSDIMKANVNALLDKCEDPSKMIDQTLRDLRESLAQVKKETAGVMADEKSAETKLHNCKVSIDEANNAARNALKSGNEDDAKKIISRKQELEKNYEQLEQTYQLAHDNAEKMRQMHDKLKSDIESLEMRKDTIKAKVATAKAQQTVNKVTSNSNSNASLEAFDRMEAKADKMLNAAMAEAELNTESNSSADLVSKYSAGSSASVDEELEALKAEMGL